MANAVDLGFLVEASFAVAWLLLAAPLLGPASAVTLGRGAIIEPFVGPAKVGLEEFSPRLELNGNSMNRCNTDGFPANEALFPARSACPRKLAKTKMDEIKFKSKGSLGYNFPLHEIFRNELIARLSSDIK